MGSRPSMPARPRGWLKRTSPSARPWVVRPEPGWRRRRPCRPAPTRCCGASSRRRSIDRDPAVSSASTTGPGARDSATAPSSSTSRRMTSSISCRTATPRPSRRGSRLIPASSWSAATVVGLLSGRLRSRPKAQQVADRWHLLKNVREAIERLLRASSAGHHRRPQAGRSRSDGRTPTPRPSDDVPTPRRPRSQVPRHRRRLRLPASPRRGSRARRSDSGASSGSSGFMSFGAKGRRSDRSPANSACRGSQCAATFVASNAPTGGPDGPRVRGWTRTGSGSTPALPRDGSTHPNCIVNSWREEFDSRTARSVAISPSVWDGPARCVPG